MISNTPCFQRTGQTWRSWMFSTTCLQERGGNIAQLATLSGSASLTEMSATDRHSKPTAWHQKLGDVNEPCQSFNAFPTVMLRISTSHVRRALRIVKEIWTAPLNDHANLGTKSEPSCIATAVATRSFLISLDKGRLNRVRVPPEMNLQTGTLSFSSQDEGNNARPGRILGAELWKEDISEEWTQTLFRLLTGMVKHSQFVTERFTEAECERESHLSSWIFLNCEPRSVLE